MLDVQFINPFIIAAQMVLSTQCNIVLKAGKPYIKKAEKLPMEIAGVLNVDNPRFNGSIALCFRTEVFLNVYEKMVGERHATITPELEDAAAEILNMIFGQAKVLLNELKGYALERSLPTIVTGENLTLRQLAASPTIALPFESSAGSFHIEVYIDKTKNK